MKRIFLFTLLIFTLSFSAFAQKLFYGGKPKPFESKGGIKAFEVKFPDGVYVRKLGRENEDERNGKFSIGKNRDEFNTLPAAIDGASSLDNFYVYYGDLDKNKSSELVIVDFDGQSNGIGIRYYTVHIFPDFQTKGWQTPVSFSTQEFGANGTFIYDAKTNETLILITDFNGLDNISKNGGTYFIGRFFRYQNGMMKLAADKPVYARRYLNSFEKERWQNENNPLRPWIWLNTPKAQKIKADPEFSIKPVTSQIGIIEKFETLTERAKDGDDEVEVKFKQIQIKLASGERKTVIVSRNYEYLDLASEKSKIYVDTMGLMPSLVSLPQAIDLEVFVGKLEGRKVVLNTYSPYSFDEEKRPRYKLLFY